MTPSSRRPRSGALPPVLAFLLVLLCRCGGAVQSEAPPAAAPEGQRRRELEEAPAPSTAAPPMHALTPPAEPPPPPASPADQPLQRAAARAAARGDVERAQRELDAAGNDCESACRALASMERATSHLCSLAEESEDQRRCDDARLRLTSAKGRVRAACGACR